jgi:RNA polymerase sigma factor (sigma-70 family)
MTLTRFGSLRQQLQRILCLAEERLSDAQLLERFVKHRDEQAFAALVGRYGRLVLGVCARLLPNASDAEDAFQATFLVLVRNAASLRPAHSLGHWLYIIAYRTAMKARIKIARRCHHEITGIDGLSLQNPEDSVWEELHPVLDEELTKLPKTERAVLVMYYLEGRSQREIANDLRLPLGSISRCLARARRLLRMRLTRRGVGATSAAIFAAIARNATAGMVPAVLSASTITGALRYGTGAVASVSVSAKAASLADAVVKLLAAGKLTVAGSILLLAGLLSTGWWITCHRFVPGMQTSIAGLLEVSRRPVPHAGGLCWRLQNTVPAEGTLAAALTRDESLLALGSRMPDSSVRLWDLATNQERCRLIGHKGSVHSVIFSTSGKLLATGSQDRTVKLWDVERQGEIRTLKGHTLGITCLALTIGSDKLASGGLDRSIRIWDTTSGEERVILDAHSDVIRCVAFSPDGKLLVSGGADGRIAYWDPRTGGELCRWHAHLGGVTYLSFAANGERVVSSGRDGTSRIWDVDKHAQLAVFMADADWIKRAAFSRDGDVLAAETSDLRRPLWPLDMAIAGNAATDCPGATIQLRWATIEDHQVKVWRLLHLDCQRR